MNTSGNRWHLYDELLDTVPHDQIVKSFDMGPRWLLLETDTGGTGMAMNVPSGDGFQLSPQKKFDVVGKPLWQVAQLIKSWDFQEAGVGLAALNAAVNTLPQVQQGPLFEALHATGDAFDYFLEKAMGKKVTVIGHFPAMGKLRAGSQLTVLERNPQEGDLPDSAAEYVLPEQDMVFITGTTFINKTITRLLELTTKAKVCLTGPSTPMHPLLFKHGLASLSGLIVEDPEAMRKGIQIDKCGAIFKTGGRKVNMVNPESWK